MKTWFACLGICGVIGALTIVGIIPAVLGVGAMLLIVALKDIIYSIFLRGLPAAMVAAKIKGGILFGVMGKDYNIRVGRFDPVAGIVHTKHHGAYNLNPEGEVRLDGVPFAIAPDDLAYNVKLEHLELIRKLKERGVSDITEVADLDQYGRFKGWKDDPRINDLKKKLTEDLYRVCSREIYLPGLQDMVKYVHEAAHPYRTDAEIKLGITRGLPGLGQPKWLIYVGVLVLLVCVGLVVLFAVTGRGGQEIRIVLENLLENRPPIVM